MQILSVTEAPTRREARPGQAGVSGKHLWTGVFLGPGSFGEPWARVTSIST